MTHQEARMQIHGAIAGIADVTRSDLMIRDHTGTLIPPWGLSGLSQGMYTLWRLQEILDIESRQGAPPKCDPPWPPRGTYDPRQGAAKVRECQRAIDVVLHSGLPIPTFTGKDADPEFRSKVGEALCAISRLNEALLKRAREDDPTISFFET